MYLFELFATEQDNRYQSLAITNSERQFEFLEAVVGAALQSNHNFLSHAILKALNFHAIACLHPHAGEYRQCEVQVVDEQGAVGLTGVSYWRVPSAMDQFLNVVNSRWNDADPVSLAAFVLWQICRIHPFVNGNGRTARAACYFVLCVKAGGLLSGKSFAPALLKARPDYLPALRAADATNDLSALHKLITELVAQQLASGVTEVNESGLVSRE